MSPYTVQQYKELLRNLETAERSLEELKDNEEAYKRKLEHTSASIPSAADEIVRYEKRVYEIETAYPELLKIKSEIVKRI
jgi:predicted  nucleic acid-binding Zn-ribbon protein